jgi:phage I-like protein
MQSREAVMPKIFDFEFAGEVQAVSDWQMILPVGDFQTAKYGELKITKKIVNDIVSNWKDKALGERLPFVDTDHDQAAANGWVVELKAEDNGLFAKIEWTDIGRENVEKKRYRYFSAMIAKHQNIETGEEVWPVLKAVSLTNTPVMDNMPAVTLNDKSGVAAIEQNPRRGNMNFTELLKALGELKANLKPEELKALSEALGIDQAAPAAKESEAVQTAQSKAVETLSNQVKELSETVIALKAKDSIVAEDAFFDKALAEGRIKPVDRDDWVKLYRKDPDGVGKMIAKLPPSVDLSVHGMGTASSENFVLSARQEKTLKEQFNMTDEQIKKYFLNEKPEPTSEKK